jgi:hypothetical protein
MRALAPFLVLAAGCGAGDLAQSWQLDRIRLLAVAAEPAEPQPGELTTFTALRYYPPDVGEGITVWFACIPDSDSASGCDIDTSTIDGLGDVDPDSMTPEELAALYAELQASGLAGVEPYLPPTWTPPSDALDGLDDTEALEGVNGMVTISMVPEGEDDEVELAYKRVPVSLSLQPNENPSVAGWRIDGTEADVDVAGVLMGPSDVVEVELVLADDAVESYDYTDLDTGEVTVRTEEPYFTSYVEDGSFDQPFALYDPDVEDAAVFEYTAPDEPFEGAIRVVVRDRRGGMAWAELPVRVE